MGNSYFYFVARCVSIDRGAAWKITRRTNLEPWFSVGCCPHIFVVLSGLLSVYPIDLSYFYDIQNKRASARLPFHPIVNFTLDFSENLINFFNVLLKFIKICLIIIKSGRELKRDFYTKKSGAHQFSQAHSFHR